MNVSNNNTMIPMCKLNPNILSMIITNTYSNINDITTTSLNIGNVNNNINSSILNDFLLKLPTDMISLFSDFKLIITKIKLLQMKFNSKHLYNQIESIISELLNETKYISKDQITMMISMDTDKLLFNSSILFSQVIDLGRLIYHTKLSNSHSHQISNDMKPLPIASYRTMHGLKVKMNKIQMNIKQLTDLRDKILTDRDRKRLHISSIQDVDALLNDIDIQFQNFQTTLVYLKKHILAFEEEQVQVQTDGYLYRSGWYKQGGMKLDGDGSEMLTTTNTFDEGQAATLKTLSIESKHVKGRSYKGEDIAELSEEIVEKYREKRKKRNQPWDRLVLGIKSSNRPTYSLAIYDLIKDKEEELLKILPSESVSSSGINSTSNFNTRSTDINTQKIAWKQATAKYRHLQGIITHSTPTVQLPTPSTISPSPYTMTQMAANYYNHNSNSIRSPSDDVAYVEHVANEAVEGFLNATILKHTNKFKTTHPHHIHQHSHSLEYLGDWRHISGSNGTAASVIANNNDSLTKASNICTTLSASAKSSFEPEVYESPIKDAMKYMREYEKKEEERAAAVALLNTPTLSSTSSTIENKTTLQSSNNFASSNQLISKSNLPAKSSTGSSSLMPTTSSESTLETVITTPPLTISTTMKSMKKSTSAKNILSIDTSLSSTTESSLAGKNDTPTTSSQGLKNDIDKIQLKEIGGTTSDTIQSKVPTELSTVTITSMVNKASSVITEKNTSIEEIGGKDSSSGAGIGSTTIAAVQKRVQEIYSQYNPAKISEIPTLLEKYKGREQELIKNLEKKYNVPPSTTSNTTNTISNNTLSASNLFKTNTTGNSLFGTKTAIETNISANTTNSLFTKSANSITPTPFSVPSPSSKTSTVTPIAITANNTLFAKSTTSLSSFEEIKKETTMLSGSSDSSSSIIIGPGIGSTAIVAVQKRVQEIYSQYNPAKISEIPTLLEKYKGREQELIKNLEKKYNVPPSTTSNTNNTLSASNLFKTNTTGNSLFGTKTAIETNISANTTNSLFTKNANSFTPTPFSVPSPVSSSNTNTLFANKSNTLFSNPLQSNSAGKATSLFNSTPGQQNILNNYNNSNSSNVKASGSPFSSGFNTPIGDKTISGFNTLAMSGNNNGSSLFGMNQSTIASSSSSSPFPIQSQTLQPSPFSGAGTSQSSLFGTKLTNTAYSNNTIAAVQKRVQEIYSQYNPAKISEIPTLLEKYKGREQELIKNLEKKYNVPPSTTSNITNTTNTISNGMNFMGQNNMTTNNSLFSNSTILQQPSMGFGNTPNSILNQSNSSPFNSNNNNTMLSSNSNIKYNSGFGSASVLGNNNNRPVTTSLFGNSSGFNSGGLFGSSQSTINNGMNEINNDFHMLG